MRFKALLAALFVAGLAVSVAVAHPPPGKGKKKDAVTAASSTSTTETDGAEPGCKPKVSFILKGDYVSGTSDSFAMNVKQANKHGRQFVGKQVTVKVDASTNVKRRGKATLSSLQAGDKLVVHVRACKAKKGEAAAASAPELYAKKVDAKGPKGEKKGDDDDDSTTTTTGTTSTGTTTTATTTTTTTTTSTTP